MRLIRLHTAILAALTMVLVGVITAVPSPVPSIANSCDSKTAKDRFKIRCKDSKKGPKRDRTPPKKDRDGSGRGDDGGNRNGDNSDRDRRDNNADSGPRACQLLEGDPGSRARQCERRRPPSPDRDGTSPPDTDFYVEPPPDVTWEDVGETSIPPLSLIHI